MRHLRNKCYGADTDYRWFVYDNHENSRARTLAIWDWKHPSKFQSRITYDKNAALKANCDMADDLGVPFFIGITCTKNESDQSSQDCTAPQLALAPSIYVIAGNKPAHDALVAIDPKAGGIWMAAAELIALHHQLCDYRVDPDTIRPMLTTTGLPGKEIDISNQPVATWGAVANVDIDWLSLKSYSVTWRI